MRAFALLLFGALGFHVFQCSGRADNSVAVTNLAPLGLRLPAPSFGWNGPAEPPPPNPHLEPLADHPRRPFLAPVGITNLAFHRAVTLSAPQVFRDVAAVTDGDKEARPPDAREGAFELRKGKQWVQVDLGDSCPIYAILIWHDFYRIFTIFRAVVVQIAEDPKFSHDVSTVFNNDYANLLGFGPGADKEYVETNEGKLIDAKGTKGRYVRCWTIGSNKGFSRYSEIEIWGLPQN